MIFEMASCGGCRTCEMACSYKHKGTFIPHASSIIIIENKARMGFSVQLTEQGGGGRFACDGCKNLDRPMCVQYCHEAEELMAIIKKYLNLTDHDQS